MNTDLNIATFEKCNNCKKDYIEKDFYFNQVTLYRKGHECRFCAVKTVEKVKAQILKEQKASRSLKSK